ncbi:hypothetical protein Tco_1113692 [Tanacetum coccineum]|uniref:Uncharacterized protein n=1 Tax=Tanacetum coccineum TaxID=301880 RepID=A0ABQ5ISZ7_9ASTR
MSKTIKISKSKRFVGGSWSDSDEDEEEKQRRKGLMSKASMRTKVMAKNKTLKQAKIELENKALELKDKLYWIEKVTKMPKATTTDISLTKSYIPKVSKIPGISPTIAQFYKPIENRNIHEGRVVDQAYYKSNNIERLFTNIHFNCLFQINEPIVPRFILDFYSQVMVQTDEYGYLVISFMIQHEFITLTLAQFGQILKIPYNGQAIFTNEWDLASLEYSQETEGPYCTELPTPDDIHRLLELECVVTRRTSGSSHDCRSMLYCVLLDLTQDDTKTSSPKLPISSPSAPNAPSKTPSTKDTSSSSIDYIPKSPTSSTTLSPNGYLNPPTSPPSRVSPPHLTQENASMDITLTLFSITPLDV